MKNFISLTLFVFSFITFNTWALTQEELNQSFIGASERGPLRIEHLLKIESALHDLGMGDYLLNLKDKLRVDTLEGVSNYVHACQTETDVLGYYRRGVTRSFMQSIEYGQDIFAKDWGDDAAKLIEKAYKHQIVNMNSHVALVIMEWPIICIRPNQKFGSILSTFAHEVTHYVNDDELPMDYSQTDDEIDFSEKNLMSAGGEYDAFQASGKVINVIQKEFDIRIRSALMQYFEDGEVVDSQGLKNYILFELGYGQRFKKEYREGIVRDYNQNISDESFLRKLLYNYQENLRVNEFNLNVYRSNLGIYQQNIEIHGGNHEIVKSAIARGNRKYTQSDLDALQRKIAGAKSQLESAKQKLSECEAAIRFYKNMITFTEASLDKIARGMADVKNKIDSARNSTGSGVIIR